MSFFAFAGIFKDNVGGENTANGVNFKFVSTLPNHHPYPT
jgi:hypothetical protein